MEHTYPKDYTGYTVEEVIEQAKSVKSRHGYSTKAAICKTFYAPNKFSIGFRFDDCAKVGDKGTFPSGDKFEVIALA